MKGAVSGAAVRCARVRPFWACALLALPAFAGNLAPTAGQYGAGLGAGGAVAAERSAWGGNPASLRPGDAGFHLHFHRPYGLEGLAVAEAGAFADGTRWGMSAAWRQTGAEELYREQGFEVTQTFRLWGGGDRFPAARPVADALPVPGASRFPGILEAGGCWTAWRIEMPGRKPEFDGSQGFGLAWRMLPRLKAGAFVLGLPLSGDGPSHFDRILHWGMEASGGDVGNRMGRPSQILRLDFRKTGETPWRSLASLSWSPHAAVRFTGGLANPPFQIAAGVRVSCLGFAWDQAVRHHRYLGRTWLSGMAFSRAQAPRGRQP